MAKLINKNQLDPVSAVFTHLGVVASSGDVLAVGGVGQALHVVEVSLLFEDVGLTLPLPHQQLAQPPAPQGQPVARLVEGHCGNVLVRDATNRNICNLLYDVIYSCSRKSYGSLNNIIFHISPCHIFSSLKTSHLTQIHH